MSVGNDGDGTILETLKFLHSRPKKSLHNYVGAADSGLIRGICECCLNILNGTVNPTPDQLSKLAGYSNVIRQLSRKNVPLYRRKELIQTGGFLTSLLPIAISLLSHGL